MQANLPSAGLVSALSSKSKKINSSKLFLDVSMARLSVRFKELMSYIRTECFQNLDLSEIRVGKGTINVYFC